MISMLRSSMGKKTYKYVLWVTLLGLGAATFIFVPLGKMAKFRDNTMVMVNKREVSNRAYQHRVGELEAEIRDVKANAGEFAPFILQMRGLQGDPHDLALRELIQKQVLIDSAYSLGLRAISPKFITEKMVDVAYALQFLGEVIPPYFYRSQGGLDLDALNHYVRRQGMSNDDFDTALEEAVIMQQVIGLLPSAVYAPRVSLRAIEAANSSTRTFLAINLKLETYKAALQSAGVNDTQVKNFFEEENRASRRYWTQEERGGKVWKFAPKAYGLLISEADLRRSYEQLKEKFGSKKFEDIKADLQKEVLAERFAQRFTSDANRVFAQAETGPAVFDEFVKSHQGESLQLSDAPKALSKAFFGIARIGQRRAVTLEGVGYIVQLDEIKQSKPQPFEVVRDQVIADFIATKAHENLEKDCVALAKDLQGKTEAGVEEVLRAYPSAHRSTLTLKSSDEEAWKKAGETLPVQRMRRMMHPGFDIYQINQNGGVIVFLQSILTTVDTVQKATSFEEDKADLSLVGSAFIASLSKHAKIIYRNEQHKTTPIQPEE